MADGFIEGAYGYGNPSVSPYGDNPYLQPPPPSTYGMSPGERGGNAWAPNQWQYHLPQIPSQMMGTWQNSPAYLQAIAQARAGLQSAMGPLMQEQRQIPAFLKQQLASLGINQAYDTQAAQGNLAERGMGTAEGKTTAGIPGWTFGKIGAQYAQQRQGLAENAQQQLAQLAAQMGNLRMGYAQQLAGAGLANQSYNQQLGPTQVTPSQTKIMDQLRAGFLASGRTDLARAVTTPQFWTWINAESGWNPNIVARNGAAGLFQFLGHPWQQAYMRGGRFSASPEEQARLVAQYFSWLNANSINRYAQEIQNNTYRGWG